MDVLGLTEDSSVLSPDIILTSTVQYIVFFTLAVIVCIIQVCIL